MECTIHWVPGSGMGFVAETGSGHLLTDLAADLYPFLPARWLARLSYDTRRTLQDVRAPVLVAHSREDEIIPYKHGVALYAAVPGPRQFLELRGGHNDLFFANSDEFAQGVGDFVQRHLAQSR